MAKAEVFPEPGGPNTATDSAAGADQATAHPTDHDSSPSGVGLTPHRMAPPLGHGAAPEIREGRLAAVPSCWPTA
ncbi:MAG: hypothetical protein LC739_04975 [Actinobacteria bacterium]|nr:hypothetical protein [Actinomycetota bacterium]